MILLAHHKKMSSEQVSDLCRAATAIIGLCEGAAWAAQNSNAGEIPQTMDDMQHALKAAQSMLETIQDRLDAQDTGKAAE